MTQLFSTVLQSQSFNGRIGTNISTNFVTDGQSIETSQLINIIDLQKEIIPPILLGSTFHFDNHKLYSFLTDGLNMVIFHKIS